jgi:high-affinity iron transporter
VEIGSFASGLVTGLREGVEAALVVSIILAYLVRTGHGAQAGRVWLGVAAAIVASALFGLALFVTVGEFRAPYEQLFEAGTMLLAAGVVTWMLFWMRRQAANVAGELRAAVDRAVSDGGVWALVALAFVAVIREGVETSLFLVGQASAASTGAVAGGGGPLAILAGALTGLAIAAALGVGFYHGSRRIDLGRFFRWTGIALVLIAGGLIASAVHELVEIRAVTAWTAPAFDLGGLLPSTEAGGNIIGMLLGALFGYRAAPEVIAVVVWAAYVSVTLALYLRPVRRAPAVASGTLPLAAPVLADPAPRPGAPGARTDRSVTR